MLRLVLVALSALCASDEKKTRAELFKELKATAERIKVTPLRVVERPDDGAFIARKCRAEVIESRLSDRGEEVVGLVVFDVWIAQSKKADSEKEAAKQPLVESGLRSGEFVAMFVRVDGKWQLVELTAKETALAGGGTVRFKDLPPGHTSPVVDWWHAIRAEPIPKAKGK